MTADHEWHETYWRALIDASPDAIFAVDRSGTILSSNRDAPPGGRSVIGRKIWEFGVGDAVTRLTTKLEEVIRTKKAISYENAGVRWDGAATWYEVRAVPVLVDGEVDRVLWVSSDVSERKRLEEQLRQAQKMEAIGLFAGGVAHDFNNILAVILASSRYAARRSAGDAALLAVLKEIGDASARGGELTRRLLALSRTNLIHPRALDLHAAVSDFAGILRRVLGDDVRLVLHEPDEKLDVHADPIQLEQILMNLCTNARQAMPEGGELHVSTAATHVDAAFLAEQGDDARVREGSFAEIRVRDTGAGMDDATRARVFEPFFTTKAEGTGLGLSTVDTIVRQHGGFVRVESRPARGTTVSVFLPRTPRAPRVPAVSSP